MRSAVLVLLALLPALADNRVLVVYENSANSITVANYYKAARSVPTGNMCELFFTGSESLMNRNPGGRVGNGTDGNISWSQYRTLMQTPIKTCLSTASSSVTHIVLIHVRPWVIHDDTITQDHNTSDYSVDSFLHDINDTLFSPTSTSPGIELRSPYNNTDNTPNSVYKNYQSMSAYNTANPGAKLYIVGRLATPTVAATERLIDDAIFVETHGGLQGEVCQDDDRDVNYDTVSPHMITVNDNGYTQLSYDIYAARNISKSFNFTTIWDFNGALIGTAPAPLTCGPIAIYTGWYAKYYQPTFTWSQGSIGMHYYSGQTLDIEDYTDTCCGVPTGELPWTAGILTHGAAFASANTTEQTTVGHSEVDSMMAWLYAGSTVGEAFWHGLQYSRWRQFSIGDPLYTPFPVPLIAPPLGNRKHHGQVTHRGPRSLK